MFKKSNKKSGEQKHWIKNLYWPITAKMTTPTQFPTNEFLTPRGYKRTLRAHLKSNWPQTLTRFNREIEVFSTSNFLAIALSSYWWRHQIRQTKYTFNHFCISASPHARLLNLYKTWCTESQKKEKDEKHWESCVERTQRW